MEKCNSGLIEDTSDWYPLFAISYDNCLMGVSQCLVKWAMQLLVDKFQSKLASKKRGIFV